MLLVPEGVVLVVAGGAAPGLQNLVPPLLRPAGAQRDVLEADRAPAGLGVAAQAQGEDDLGLARFGLKIQVGLGEVVVAHKPRRVDAALVQAVVVDGQGGAPALLHALGGDEAGEHVLRPLRHRHLFAEPQIVGHVRAQSQRPRPVQKGLVFVFIGAHIPVLGQGAGLSG